MGGSSPAPALDSDPGLVGVTIRKPSVLHSLFCNMFRRTWEDLTILVLRGTFVRESPPGFTLTSAATLWDSVDLTRRVY